jgi:hypothetical protein
MAALRGWDSYERTSGGPAIVDFDLAEPDESIPFGSREDVLRELASLTERLGDSGHSAVFLHARLRASMTYLRALMGEQIPFQEYVESTLGVTPSIVAESDLIAAQVQAEELLHQYGFKFRREQRDRFEKRFLIRDESKIESGILSARNKWLDRLRSFDIPVPKQLRLSVRSVNVDAPWANWITGSLAKGFNLSINLHPRKKYQRGSPLALCLHEICGHAAQMAIWSRRIQEGHLNPACGITMVHAPEAFVAEGIAQTVHLLLERKFDLPPNFRLRKALQYHWLLTMQNAHLMLYAGESLETALDYADERLPMSHREDIALDLRDRVSNPLSRTYELSYSLSETALRRLTSRMGLNQIQNFFKKLFQVPMTPSQMFEHVKHLSKEEGA